MVISFASPPEDDPMEWEEPTTATQAPTKRTRATKSKIVDYFPINSKSTDSIATSDGSGSESAPPAKKQKSASGKAVATAKKPRARQVKTTTSDQPAQSPAEGPRLDGYETDPEEVKEGDKIDETVAPLELDDYNLKNGMDNQLPPMFHFNEFTRDMASKLAEQFRQYLKNHGNSFRIGTMCSGTDSPIWALERLFLYLNVEHGVYMELNHEFSVEIVEHKQQLIRDNFQPTEIFRDVRDFSRKDTTTAMTAYGAEVEVAGNLDLLVAGFACVDFSKLNLVGRKVLLEKGRESGDTLFGISDYADLHRPKLIVLENVQGAPWETHKLPPAERNKGEIGIDDYMRNLGYEPAKVCVNAKVHYIPQTRNRGYMVCIDKERAYNLMYKTQHPLGLWEDFRKLCNPEQLAELEKILQVEIPVWQKLIIALRRPATSTAEQMLLEEDDELLDSLRIKPKKGSDKKNEDDEDLKGLSWGKCFMGHNQYRFKLGISIKRPLTDWKSDLVFKLPDYFDSRPQLTERTFDVLDIIHLRNAKRGLDDQFYW